MGTKELIQKANEIRVRVIALLHRASVEKDERRRLEYIEKAIRLLR
jgi:hypothetical protein